MPDLPVAKIISERFETGRAFCTKLWNAVRFALLNLGEHRFTPLKAGSSRGRGPLDSVPSRRGSSTG